MQPFIITSFHVLRTCCGGFKSPHFFRLWQNLEFDLDKSVSQIPKCTMNVFFFFPESTEKICRSEVYQRNYLSFFFLFFYLGKWSWSKWQPSEWWWEFNRAHQSGESIISFGFISTRAGGLMQGDGQGHWDSACGCQRTHRNAGGWARGEHGSADKHICHVSSRFAVPWRKGR